jgi:hypothetical protein
MYTGPEKMDSVRSSRAEALTRIEVEGPASGRARGGWADPPGESWRSRASTAHH